jgi:hypothetical protein
MKRAAGRPKDLETADELEALKELQARQPTLDAGENEPL